MLQRVAVCCSVRCNELQCRQLLNGFRTVDVMSVMSVCNECNGRLFFKSNGANVSPWHGSVCCSVLQCDAVRCSVMQCVPACCSVLQCVAVCCSMLQCVAVPCIACQTTEV